MEHPGVKCKKAGRDYGESEGVNHRTDYLVLIHTTLISLVRTSSKDSYEASYWLLFGYLSPSLMITQHSHGDSDRPAAHPGARYDDGGADATLYASV
ncbi:hypothetical protein DNTS_007201 [Danionella cerebrum]|uniref:Uncharacterized protein n=1 Tax=Danionella cerebrum TaxID=2873325 RepID=A0A553QR08_9TELE|nr:hypothetical protein DNTS_007201 [Danionella translucida]